MINKYMSSGGHLAGRRTISAEDMTNTYLVFTATLEFLKLGSDHSVFSGITHSVFHGFNYSPPEAPFPGWIRYGAYYNENNTWWPYLHHFMDYKGRLSAVLQQADMYTDIGVLPPLSDMWSTMGMQNEPFPERTNVPWFTLVWEAIHKHGNGCDYLSDEIIRDAAVRGGKLCYGPKAYGTVFLVAVERMHPEGLERLLEFVRQGGRLFCVDRQPCLSLGWNGHEAADRRVRELVRQLRGYPDRFIVLEKPADNDFMGWYAGVQRQYALTPYLTFSDPDPFLIQNRYTADGGEEVFFIANTRLYEPHRTRVTFSGELFAGQISVVLGPDERGSATGWNWTATGDRPRSGARRIDADRFRPQPQGAEVEPAAGHRREYARAERLGCRAAPCPRGLDADDADGGAGGPARDRIREFRWRCRLSHAVHRGGAACASGVEPGARGRNRRGGAERPSLRCALVRTAALRPDGIAARWGRIPSK